MAKAKRVTMKLKCPNPLFEKWLTEWRDKARESGWKIQHSYTIAIRSLQKYPLPLETGKDCKLLHGFGDTLCKMLDDKLAKYKQDNPNLDLTRIGIEEGVVGGVERKTKRKPKRDRDKEAESGPSKRRSIKEYIPQYQSGAFAILVTMLEKSQQPNYVGYMKKAEIIKEAQHLSTASFTKPDPGSHYTAWSSMKTLIDKKLVVKESNPAKFSLSPEGIELADRLYIQQKIQEFENQESQVEAGSSTPPVSKNIQCEATLKPSSSYIVQESQVEAESSTPVSKNIQCEATLKPSSSYTVSSIRQEGTSTKISQIDVPISSQASSSSGSCSSVQRPLGGKLLSREESCNSISSNQSAVETVILAPNSFEIVLLVDNQEINSSKSKSQNDLILVELQKLNIPYELRNLKVGDYTWICKAQGAELVLPYIIERKRMDDLAYSIKDGRFHEQKFRLKNSGIQNLIYLVESHGRNQYLGLPLSSLYQAATNTLIQDGFMVKFTDDLRGTSEYLACLSKIITKQFKDKTVVSCAKEDLVPISIGDDLISVMNFKDFNRNSDKRKHLKVKDMFVRQLIQISGMSVEKALSVVEKYPTPKLLKLAYEEITQDQGEKLVSTIQFGTLRKKIGATLSKVVYQFFCNKSF